MTKKLFFSLLFFALAPRSFALAAEPSESSFYLYGQKFTVLSPADSGNSQEPLPLVVLFHGCKIDAADMIRLSKIKQHLQKQKFIMLAPDQSRLLNFDSCWNWFLPLNQQNTYWSELSVQKEALQWALNHYSVNADRVYLMGFSSGASIALNMFYCHPESFAGVAVHSGVAFKAAEDLYEADTAITSGSPKSDAKLAQAAYECQKPAAAKLQHKKLVVFHGSEDQRVIPKNASQLVQQFLGFWDLVDDSSQNQSANIHTRTFTRGPAEFPTHITRHRIGTHATADYVQISNLAHRWSGGSPHSPYGEPKSFDATSYSLNLFFNSSDHVSLKGR